MDLVTYAADSHVPRAENAIRSVKKRLKSIQSETPFTKYPTRLRIEILKRATVLINSFKRKAEVHSVMSLRLILFGKKFKTPLCKMGKLVLAYDIRANNNTSRPTAFYALYIGPNDDVTGHLIFKLPTKKMIITQRCKPVPMPDNIINVMNKIREKKECQTGFIFATYIKNQLLMIYMEMLTHKMIAVVHLMRVGVYRRMVVN